MFCPVFCCKSNGAIESIEFCEVSLQLIQFQFLYGAIESRRNGLSKIAFFESI